MTLLGVVLLLNEIGDGGYRDDRGVGDSYDDEKET